MDSTVPRVIGPHDGRLGFLGSIGVRFLIDGAESGGGFSLVEHPMSPRALAAPLHRHAREDEYSYVTEGRVGAMLGDQLLEAGPGTLIFKPRNQWHTFWNAGDEPARILEIISPAGFEQYFAELAAMGGSGMPPRTRFARFATDTRSRSIRRASRCCWSVFTCASGSRSSGS
jgi:mannose-6-phosphate isomerase-like protein (cupin superfamily)